MKHRWIFLLLVVAAVGLGAQGDDHAKDGQAEPTDSAKAERPKQAETALKPQEINLLSTMFRIPTGTVSDIYGGKSPDTSIPKAVGAALAGDEAPLAKIAADLFGTLGRTDKEDQAATALAVVEKERNAELAKQPRDARYSALLDRLFWAAKILDGNPAQVEGSDKYNAAFNQAFKDRQARTAEIKEKVQQALAGNNEAKEFLRNKLNRKTLMSFVDAQRKAGNTKFANDIVAAIAFGGKNGEQKFLDLRVGKETHRLNLGLTSESMEKALTAYSNAMGGLHSSTIVKAPLTNPDRTFSVNRSGKLDTKVAESSGGTRARAETRTATRSDSGSAKSQPSSPATKSSPESSTPKTAATEKPSSSGGGDLAGVVSKNCTGCHASVDPEATPDGKIKKGSKVLSVAEAIAATKRVPAMRDGVSEAVRQQLQAFVK